MSKISTLTMVENGQTIDKEPRQNVLLWQIAQTLAKVGESLTGKQLLGMEVYTSFVESGVPSSSIQSYKIRLQEIVDGKASTLEFQWEVKGGGWEIKKDGKVIKEQKLAPSTSSIVFSTISGLWQNIEVEEGAKDNIQKVYALLDRILWEAGKKKEDVLVRYYTWVNNKTGIAFIDGSLIEITGKGAAMTSQIIPSDQGEDHLWKEMYDMICRLQLQRKTLKQAL